MSVKIKENGKENGLKTVGEPHFFELARNGPIWLIGRRDRHGQARARGSAAATRSRLAPLRLAPAHPNWDKWSGARPLLMTRATSSRPDLGYSL